MNAIDPEPLLVRGMERPDAMLPTRARRARWAGARPCCSGCCSARAVDVKIDPANVNKSFLTVTWDPRGATAPPTCAPPLFSR